MPPQIIPSGRPQIQEEYYEEAYLDYNNIDEVEDENNITQNDITSGQFCQKLMEARPTTFLVGSQEPVE